MMTSEKKVLLQGLGIILILSGIFIFILPWLFTIPAPDFLRSFDEKSGNIGDTINGISTPFIATGAAILTFLAFWIQYKANEQQKAANEQQKAANEQQERVNDQQREDIKIERFESMYFEMIRFHRDNVNIINSHDRTSRNNLFITMFFELRFIYNLAINMVLSKEENEEQELVYEDLSDVKKEEIFKIAYIIFFSGSNPDTQNTLIKLFEGRSSQKKLFNKLNDKLKEIRREYRSLKPHLNLIIPKLTEQNEYNLKAGVLQENANMLYSFTNSNDQLSLMTKNNIDIKRPIIFWILNEPFGGHTNELGHYFEHLFNAVKFLDEHELLLKDKEEKLRTGDLPLKQYNYFKMLRAQLSNYEMLLLYYHSLSTFGEEWHNSNSGAFLKKYKVLKKMPLTYADFYKEPEDVIKKDNVGDPAMFDWYKHRNAMDLVYRMLEEEAKSFSKR